MDVCSGSTILAFRRHVTITVKEVYTIYSVSIFLSNPCIFMVVFELSNQVHAKSLGAEMTVIWVNSVNE
jgi:hypothetical protein